MGVKNVIFYLSKLANDAVLHRQKYFYCFCRTQKPPICRNFDCEKLPIDGAPPPNLWAGEVAQSMACNISKWSLWWIQLNTCISFVIQINRYSTAPSNGTNLAQAIDGAVLYLMVWITKIMHKLSCIHHKLHFDILQAILWATSPTHPLWFGREPFTFSYHFPPSHLNIWVTSEILVWKCSLTYKLHDTVCGRHLNIILESSIKKVWAKTADFFRFFRIP